MSGYDKFGVALKDPAQQGQQGQGITIASIATMLNDDAIKGAEGWIKGTAQQANETARQLSSEVSKLIDSMNISDALGYKQGFFDMPQGITVGEQVIRSAGDVAHRSFHDGILGTMMMANGRVQEGLTLYDSARKQGDASLSMMQRVSNQFKVLKDPNASEAEKAMARTNLGKSVGNRQELVQSTQALMPGLASLAAAKISTEAAKAQVVASSYGPLASLIGLQSNRFGSLMSGGQSAQDLSDVVKAHNTMAGLLKDMMESGEFKDSKEFKDVMSNTIDISKQIYGRSNLSTTDEVNVADTIWKE